MAMEFTRVNETVIDVNVELVNLLIESNLSKSYFFLLLPIVTLFGFSGMMHPNPAFSIEHRALDHRQFFPFPRPGSRVVWKRRRYLWGVVGLHEEIEDFIKFMEPTDVEQAMRDDVVRRIRNIVTDLWLRINTFLVNKWRLNRTCRALRYIIIIVVDPYKLAFCEVGNIW